VRGLFFKAASPFGAGLFDDQLSILPYQRLELLIIRVVLTNDLNLVWRNVTGHRLAVFSTLEVVVGPVGALPDNAEFARLHSLDLGNLLKELSGRGLIHSEIYTNVYIMRNKKGFPALFA
jgi:hypothetical protein